MFDSREDTNRHIGLVQKSMNCFISNLCTRRDIHDVSKLDEPEKSGIDKFRPILKQIGYGNAGYNELKLEAFGRHHYEVNDHHVEHYENGIYGMTLNAFCEMFCDWYAAVQTNGPDDDIFKSIEMHKDMLGPLGVALFTNTAIWMKEQEKQNGST